MFMNEFESAVNVDFKVINEFEQVGELANMESVNNEEQGDVESFSLGSTRSVVLREGATVYIDSYQISP